MVGAGVAGHRVVAVLALEHVDAVAAGDPVEAVELGRRRRERSRAAVPRLDDAWCHRHARRAAEPDGDGRRRLAGDGSQDLAVVAQHHVVAGSAEDGVVGVGLTGRRGTRAAGGRGAASHEVVGAEVTLDPVDIRSALDVVVSCVSLEPVGAPLAEHDVLVVTAEDLVGTGVGEHRARAEVEQDDAVGAGEAAHPRDRRRVGCRHARRHDSVVAGDQIRSGVAVKKVSGIRASDARARLLEQATHDLVLAPVAVHGVEPLLPSRWSASSPPLTRSFASPPYAVSS